jgi:AcrR family transcriptional regulator
MRKRKPGRAHEIAQAALAVFIRQGFRLTQMADVAREAGISPGALYTYVDSKEALFELALVCALGEVPENNQSYPSRGFTNTGTVLSDRLAKSFRWPILTKALKQTRIAPDVLRKIVGEHFTLFAQHRHLIWLLDRCAADLAELNGFYQTAVRGRCIADFTRAIQLSSVSSRLPEEDMTARGRALFEIVAWMAMHRHRDRLPPAISDETAREATVEIVLLAVQAGIKSRLSHKAKA